MAPTCSMSLESDDNQASKPIDLDFILAMFERFGVQSTVYAKKLDKDRAVYYGYAVFDSLSSSSSMFNYACNFLLTNNNSDAVHELMMTPAAIIAITAESLFLVGFSVLAVKFDKEKEESYKKWIATAWPYFRDVMKALKNGYKGARSVIVAASLLSDVDLKFMINPVGLILGGLAAANRFWLRDMVELRKVMMDANGDLLKEIQNLLSLTQEESKDYFKDIQEQSIETRINAYLSVAVGGFLDGLYLYVGVLGLAVLSFPMLSFMSVMCSVYTVACVVTRVYEEYDFQQRLLITQSTCRLEIVARELETTYLKLLALQLKPNKNQDDLLELHRLRRDVYRVLDNFEMYRNILSQQSVHTYTTSALLGLKNGLYAYGSLASVLFFSSSMLTMAGVAFPPVLIILSSILGLVFMMGFTIHSLNANYISLSQEQTKNKRPYDRLVDMRNKIQLNLDLDDLLGADTFRISMVDGLSVKASKKYYYQEWFEILRSFFSGLGKGQKFIGFAGNFMQYRDDMGHYHDSNIMIVLELFSALLFGTILALRALARGLGRVPLGQKEESSTGTDFEAEEFSPENPAMNKEPCSGKTAASAPGRPAKTGTTPKVVPQSEADGESIHSTKPRTDSPTHSDSLSNHGFFETKTKKHFHRSESDRSLTSRSLTWKNTIQGLT